MWRVYRRTRKEEDYVNYKEAHNASTPEIIQYERSYEQKLACDIKHESKSFMHISYIRVFNGGRNKWLFQFNVYQRGY